LRLTVINASNNNIKWRHVLIETKHQVMAEDPLILVEETEEEDLEAQA
jgi:hypothetical protein